MYQHLKYEEELELKRKMVEELFNLEVDEITPSPRSEFYRNRMDFVVHRGKIGLRKRGKWWKVINLEECLIFSPKTGEYLNFLRKNMNLEEYSYDLFRKRGFLRYLVIREAKFAKNTMAILVTTSERNPDLSPFLEVFDSVVWEINDSLSDVSYGEVKAVLGDEFWKEKILDMEFMFLPNAFCQTNSYAAQELYKLVRELVEGGKTLVDAYAGIGTFGIILSEKFERVVGIEEAPHSIESFHVNVENLGIKNYEMKEGKVEKILQNITNVDVLLLDPPRAGVHPAVVEAINRIKPREIVYVSCNPKTQKRDIDLLEGYKIEFIRPIDMFPRTTHVENVVKLVRE